MRYVWDIPRLKQNMKRRKDPSGFPFDPWLRFRARSGGEIVKVCHQAMRITGAFSEWHEWTGMQFPESGAYIIPSALVPVEIDLAKDEGVYLEPNVWVLHEIESEAIQARLRK